MAGENLLIFMSIFAIDHFDLDAKVVINVCFFNNIFFQNTLYLHNGKQYLKNCYIEGSVDFIFGNSTALLEHCHIHCKSAGFITAQSRKSCQETTGYVFLRFKFTYLARFRKLSLSNVCLGAIISYSLKNGLVGR